MAADAVVRARIDRDTKVRAAEALHAMGLSISDAIRLMSKRFGIICITSPQFTGDGVLLFMR